MSRKDRRGGKNRPRPARSTRLPTSSRPPDKKLPPFERWPVVGAYVPMEDCWRATGLGTAGVVRQRPDGKLITAFFNLSLIDGGLGGMFGKDETDRAEIADMLDSLRFQIPP